MIGGSAYDHLVTVWGSQEFRGPDFRDVSRGWAPVPGMERVPMSIQPRRETRQDTGPGERVVGEYGGFAPRYSDIVEGDVVQILEGPEASRDPKDPRLLKVDSSRRTRHDTQLVLIDWQGDLAA